MTACPITLGGCTFIISYGCAVSELVCLRYWLQCRTMTETSSLIRRYLQDTGFNERLFQSVGGGLIGIDVTAASGVNDDRKVQITYWKTQTWDSCGIGRRCKLSTHANPIENVITLPDTHIQWHVVWILYHVALFKGQGKWGYYDKSWHNTYDRT